MNIKKIFSKRIAIALLNMGNKILYTEQNKKFPMFKVFCFINTDKLNDDWNSLK
ncbi:hypothetical protein [Clostridium sp. M14]|uniref:hypothetical protein n=1 Tax=Clostridium sp. M14 TaxID=2716311 RepID=UPI0013EEA211|nr:hypothetical protein [Clostridium sp. M14]MBZ9693407.1 hypothetical protein [Clostridium sp. M14]